MFINFINLLPVILIALGAMVTLAMEPFLKNPNKHKVLP
jgi:NADH-quinone oxidoreductase subunit N